MHANNRWLKETIRNQDLTRCWVARQLLVNQSTVDRWLQPRMRNKEKNPSYRHMPNMAVQLLKYRLADPEVSTDLL
jgi:hypothetical protein